MSNEMDVNKITAEVATELAKSTAKSVFEKVKGYFIDLQNKEEIDFGYAFENYLNYSKEVQCKIKTLLYRHTPKDIYSFYECIGLRHGSKVIDTCNLNNIAKFGHKIIITGTGGIGKSVMMKHFFLNCIENMNLVPILIELRGLNDIDEKNIDLVDYIYQVMDIYKFKLDKKYFQYSLETGCYLILLDGFDEVKNSLSKKVTKLILDLCNKYPNNYYITTSRPLEEFVGWNGFTELQSMVLTKEQALSLIKKLEYDENIKNKFYEELDENLYDKYETFASNPLLLTIMLLTFENRISIPDKLNDFYEQAFTTLFHTHDATKGGYKRDILCDLGYEDFKAVFSYFCFKSFFNSEYKFSENKIFSYLAMAKEKRIISTSFNSLNYLNDLTNSVCMLIHEGLEYRFSHRSFQEYFAALYTVQLDDEQQKKFLSVWLKESTDRLTTNYLDMLYELQPARFVKNVLCPGLLELRNFYEQNGSSKERVISMLYSHVGISKTKKDKISNCYLTVNNGYFHEIVVRTCIVGEYDKIINDIESNEDKENNDNMVKLLTEKYGKTKSLITLEKLKDDDLLGELMENLRWAVKRFDYAMEFLSKYDFLSIGRKKKLSSMLDEL
jgi:hypothetical protein